jgi:hypothetical protein
MLCENIDFKASKGRWGPSWAPQERCPWQREDQEKGQRRALSQGQMLLPSFLFSAPCHLRPRAVHMVDIAEAAATLYLA